MKRWTETDIIKDNSPREWTKKPRLYKSIYNEGTKRNCYGLDTQSQLWLMEYRPKDEYADKDYFVTECPSMEKVKIIEKGELLESKGWAGSIMGCVADKDNVADYGYAINEADEEINALMSDY